MKLCALLHESSVCPTCGGKINALGKAAEGGDTELIFPDKQGIWRDPVTRKPIETKTEKTEKTEKIEKIRIPNT